MKLNCTNKSHIHDTVLFNFQWILLILHLSLKLDYITLPRNLIKIKAGLPPSIRR